MLSATSALRTQAAVQLFLQHLAQLLRPLLLELSPLALVDDQPAQLKGIVGRFRLCQRVEHDVKMSLRAVEEALSDGATRRKGVGWAVVAAACLQQLRQGGAATR